MTTPAPTLGELLEALDWSQLPQTECAAQGCVVDVAALMNELRRHPVLARATWAGGRTLLHVAAGEGQPELVALLLGLGAEVNAEGPEGIPLHGAVGSGCDEVVKMLVEAGSDINRPECRGRTPVDKANSPAHDFAVVKYLILAGAVPNEPSTAETVRVMKAEGWWDTLPDNLLPGQFAPAWRTDTVLALARQVREAGDFGTMPILADALQDVGCDRQDVLTHCRSGGPHVRGCWVLDLVLGSQ